MIRIVVNVSGGVVQDFFAPESDAEIVIVDWDAEGAGNDDAIEAVDAQGNRLRALVSVLTAAPIAELAGTDTQIILQKAGVANAAAQD